MIIRKGHYIRGSYCIKCDTQYVRSSGIYASLKDCFKDPCQGKWKHQVEFLEDLVSRGRKELAEVRKWMAYDARSSRTARSPKVRSQDPLSHRNVPDRSQ
jgi:hypothetical protein